MYKCGCRSRPIAGPTAGSFPCNCRNDSTACVNFPYAHVARVSDENVAACVNGDPKRHAQQRLGGWTAVAAERVQAGKAKGQLIAVDIGGMDPIPGATVLRLDVLAAGAPARIKDALDGPADVVLSDMASPATGHGATDHLRVMALAEAAYAFAREVLAPGGAFVAKVLRGGTEKQLLDAIKREFKAVKHFKPAASRADSAEIYVVATGFRGMMRD